MDLVDQYSVQVEANKLLIVYVVELDLSMKYLNQILHSHQEGLLEVDSVENVELKVIDNLQI